MPNVNSVLNGWTQAMTFMVVTKVSQGFQALETGTPVSFQGVIQPFTDKQLMLKPEGERAWSWYWVHADPSLMLTNDDVIIYETVQYRVMALKDYSKNGYMEYHLIEDTTGAGPTQLGGTP